MQIGVAAVLLILGGWWLWHDVSQEAPRPIRLGLNPWPGNELLFLARDRGLFAAHGLDLHLVEFTALSDELRAYLAGDVDGMACTQVEVALAGLCAQPGQPQTVAVIDESIGADVILARPGLGSVANLRGKRVAVEPASLNLFVLIRALEQQGLALDAVTPVVMGQEAMAVALARGEVDAAVSYPPFSPAIRDVGAVTLFTSLQIPGEVVDVAAFAPAVLERDPDFPRRFQAMWAEVVELVIRDQDHAIEALAQRQHLTVAAFRQSLEGLRLIPGSEQRWLLMPDGQIERSQALVRRLMLVPTTAASTAR
jgi:NitT/TauT family transport system substrate-binding protein